MKTLILIGGGCLFIMVVVVIRVVFDIVQFNARLKRAQKSERTGDWRGAASAYKELLAACLSDEASVKLCVTGLENAYRNLGVQADVGGIWEFHRVCRDVHQSKTLSESDRRKLAEKSIADLQSFLAKCP